MKQSGGENMENGMNTTELKAEILLDILSVIRDEINNWNHSPEQLSMLANAAAQIGAIIPEGYWISIDK